MAKGANKGPSVDIVREIVSLGGRGRTLDVWMTDNFRALEIELRPRGLDWDALAKRLSQEGLTNAQGGQLTAHTMRRTWWRVRDDMSKTKAAKHELARRAPSSMKPGAAQPHPLPIQPREQPTDVRPVRPETFDFSPTPKESDNAIWKGTKPKPE